MTNSEYWQKRFKALEESTFSHSEEWKKNAEKQFAKSFVRIKEKIAWFYSMFEKETGMSYAEAKRAMDKKTLAEFKISLDEYIEMGKSLNESFDPKVYKQMEIASLRVRISRYEAIKWFIEAEIAKLYGEFQISAYEKLGEAYENRYYQTAYEMRGLGTSFARLNKKQIKVALDQPWKYGTFSETIWGNRDKLKSNLTDVLTQSIIQGQSYTQATQALEKRMKVGSSNCARVISSEMAAVSSKAQQEMFGELGVKKYEIVATLDTHTSQICQSLDGQVFNQKDYEVGVTAPPFHPQCRTSTAPVVEGFKNAQRIARDENGKSVYVDNMTYGEWAEKYNIEPVYGLWEDERK